MTEVEIKLVLEDGTEVLGTSFGDVKPVSGEVVFNTAMTGYVEMLSDPSYRGQILMPTYPLIGNYGVPGPREPGTIEGPFESTEIQVQGLIVQHYVDDWSHHKGERSLGEWLASENIPGMTGVDTRTMTRRLREAGTMRGWMFPTSMSLEEARERSEVVDMEREVFDLVTPPEVIRHEGGEPTILLVDVGAKDNIVRSLLRRGATVVRAPWNADLAALAAECDGVLLANGPGDPANLSELVEKIAQLLKTYERPIFGICMGNQILARAAGGSTYKLPYGHRGVNQPVQDLLTRRCFVTSQNHGYAVKEESLPEDWDPWFVNINDGTNEGIRSRTRPFSSVQFHPEARPGPEDVSFLFDDFLRQVGARSL